MKKLIAIFAVLSFVSIQFVHAAVLDGSTVQPHAESIEHKFSHSHADDHDANHGNKAETETDAHQDDDHALGHLHKSFHDHHQVASFLASASHFTMSLTSEHDILKGHTPVSTGFAPPVPPPLS